jgi:hypothetical protein
MNNFAFSLLTLTLTAVTTAVFAVDWSYDRHSGKQLNNVRCNLIFYTNQYFLQLDNKSD